MNAHVKRLIEVDLPIKRISEHARKEKNMRTGHPWHLHIWWARRPWGACRSVAFASLIPAPTDPNCPKEFLEKVSVLLNRVGCGDDKEHDAQKIEQALLKFTGELARFEAGNERIWIETAREIINLANPETPLAFDPFAGYGAIPAETARLGCQSVASDLNPVAVLCLKVMLEAVPKHGQKLLELYEKGVEYIKAEAERRLSQYYPKKNGKYPIAYLWARTVQCEGPACGATIPLISQATIAKGKRKAWIDIKGNKTDKSISINIKMGDKVPPDLIKTAGGGHAVCPVCNTTTHKDRVKIQGKTGKMGHRLFGVVLPVGEHEGKEYHNTDEDDKNAFDAAVRAWETLVAQSPEIEITEPFYLTYGLHVPPHYGIRSWGDIFSHRQKLSLHVLTELVSDYSVHLQELDVNKTLARDITSALALGVSNRSHFMTNLCAHISGGFGSAFLIGNGIAMRWEYFEANPLVENYSIGIAESYSQGLSAISTINNSLGDKTTVHQESATKLTLPDDSCDFFFTDPPYYDVVPYADLSDLCYIWLKRMLKNNHAELFDKKLTPKAEQIVVNPYTVADERGEQSPARYQERMTKAFEEARRTLKPEGVGCVVFAHKGTLAWEKLLLSIIDAGFSVTASWPIDTERVDRPRANDSAALQTSVHLIIRPRENPDGSLRNDAIGDWRDVLRELPPRIKAYMKRMSEEGVAGADAIFACLGPALEIFSRYSQVEKPNGEVVSLREYMEKIWEVVSHEALAMLFEDAETQGFEADARVTAIWLWTLASEPVTVEKVEVESEGDESEEKSSKPKGGFTLDSDTANRIAQSLGADIRSLAGIIEVKGDKSRLISVRERADKLFKNKNMEEKRAAKKKKEQDQMGLFGEWEMKEISNETQSEVVLDYEPGASVLDRLHQAMLFFALGRTAMLRKFLAEEGAGRDSRFWKLAQALNSLYPKNAEERRWLEGVQAYKKSLSL